MLVITTAATAFAQAPLAIYTDNLVNGFQDWSWAPHSLNNTAPVHSGNHSISVNGSAWQALSFYHAGFNTTPYASLSFWAHGGTAGGQVLQVYATVNGVDQGPAAPFAALAANTWQRFDVPLAALNADSQTNVTRLYIQLTGSGSTAVFYVDDIQLTAKPAPAIVHISLNGTQAVRQVDFRWFGVNTAIWDSNFDTPTTVSLLQEMGNRLLRCPGGSLSDEYHWVTDKSLDNTWQWPTPFSAFVHVATNAGAQAIITANYGTGTTNEAAAWVAYANGTTNNPLSLGADRFGTNWQTVGYWASLRAAAPLAFDDGMNFLRIGRAEPLGFKYWEIGNECYGTWETDSNAVPNDPWTYAMRARDYMSLMKAVDRTIRIGVVAAPGESSYSNNTNHFAVNPRTGTTNYGWTPVMLATLQGLRATPDFAIHHYYAQYTDANNPVGSDSDPLLLQCSTHWAQDAADLRQQLTDYLGTAGTNVELLCTENNSDSGAQGKQSTSLVNGVYYADSVAQLMQTEFNGFVWWDLRNGTDTSGDFDASLYGWRTIGDLGMINGLSTQFPTFYAAKLMHYFAQPGDTILGSTSDYLLLSAYGARSTNGVVSLLVLNKDTSTNFNAQIALPGFTPEAAADDALLWHAARQRRAERRRLARHCPDQSHHRDCQLQRQLCALIADLADAYAAAPRGPTGVADGGCRQHDHVHRHHHAGELADE